MAGMAKALGLVVAACCCVFLGAAAEAGKPHIVSKVIKLLEGMLKELEAEGEADQEVYDKMSCWCETNDKLKTKAISDAEHRITLLSTRIEGYTASKGKLGGELEILKKELGKYAKSIDEATAIRTKEHGEFSDEEKGLLQSIAALKSAIVVLSKHNAAALTQKSNSTEDNQTATLLQTSSTHLARVRTTVARELRRHSKLLNAKLTQKQRRVLVAFVGRPAAALLQIGAATSHPQFLRDDYFDLPVKSTSIGFMQDESKQPSGEIFGILKQMLETFEKDLAEEQKDEGSNLEGFMSLKGSIEAQMQAAKDLFDKKTLELADVGQKLATYKLDLKDTRAMLTADQKFLTMLKEKCASIDAEWEERQHTRMKEIEAINKAKAIIGSDDAHDLMTKTLGASLIQLQSKGRLKLLRSKAAKLLQSVAQKIRSPRLSALSVTCRIDAFVQVKRAIRDMIDQLLKEKKEEIKHKDWCTSELNANQLDMEKQHRDKTDTEEKIEGLHAEIDTLTKDIDTLRGDIGEMKTQLKRGGEDREIENKDFQVTVADQRAVQKLLKSALEVLKSFYDKKAAAFSQLEQPSSVAVAANNPASPPGFKSYKTNKKSGSVMGMIQQIINDAKAAEAEAIKSEEDAQKTYEDVVKETNLSIDTAAKEIVNKSEQKAVTEVDLSEAEKALEAVELEISSLESAKTDIHNSCDFVLKNFEIRQSARDEEIEAMKQAKAILSGANFEGFLQGRLADSGAFIDLGTLST